MTIDAMELFVKATYELEGDGPLVLYAYQILVAYMLILHWHITHMCLLLLRTLHKEMLPMKLN